MQRRVITSTSGGIATSTCFFHCHDETNRFQALQDNFTTVTQEKKYGSKEKEKEKTKKENKFIKQDLQHTHTQKKKKKETEWKQRLSQRVDHSSFSFLLWRSWANSFNFPVFLFFFLFLFLFLNSLVVFLKRIYGCTKRQVLLLPSDGFKHVFLLLLLLIQFWARCLLSFFFSSLSLLLFWLAAD